MQPVTLKAVLHKNGKKVVDLYYALRFKVMISYGETATYCRCISMNGYGKAKVWKAIQEILNEWNIVWEV